MEENYNIIEDLAQGPCAMSTLEFPQSCPTQKNALLALINTYDSSYSILVTFDVDNNKPFLPRYASIQPC